METHLPNDVTLQLPESKEKEIEMQAAKERFDIQEWFQVQNSVYPILQVICRTAHVEKRIPQQLKMA